MSLSFLIVASIHWILSQSTIRSQLRSQSGTLIRRPLMTFAGSRVRKTSADSSSRKRFSVKKRHQKAIEENHEYADLHREPTPVQGCGFRLHFTIWRGLDARDQIRANI